MERRKKKSAYKRETEEEDVKDQGEDISLFLRRKTFLITHKDKKIEIVCNKMTCISNKASKIQIKREKSSDSVKMLQVG